MVTKLALKVAAGLLPALLFTLPCTAQQPAAPAGPDRATQEKNRQPAASPQQPSDKDKEKTSQETGSQGKVEGTSKDRLFYTLPNFLTLQNGGQLPPLSAKDKYKVVALGTFDYVQYPWWGLLAAINQAQNNEPAFGQGWAAYGKRYGTTAADSTIENFLVGAVFPSILHQDPRFYQSGQGGFFRRTGYAVSRIFVTRSDSGHKQFNFSEILGSGLAATISTYSYHPKSTYISTPSNPHQFVSSDRTISNTASVWETQVTLDTITIVVKEFWPDIHRKISHKQKGEATPVSPVP